MSLMWVPAAYILLLLSCTDNGKRCGPRVIVQGFVSQAACVESAKSLASAIKSLSPRLKNTRAACVRGQEERDA